MSLRVEVQDVHLRYGDVTALNGVTFALDGMKILGLLGRNGSGKSSLLSLLAGFRRPTAGSICIGGEPVFENAPIVRRICLIREAADPIDEFEPATYAFEFAAQMRPQFDAAYATTLAGRFELPMHQRVRTLSRGKRSALAVILGLAARAPLTMFDESYLGLDAPSRYIFYDELLADFKAHPRTIIVSTHLIEEVSPLLEEVLIIDHGRILLHQDVETLRSCGVEVTGPAEAVDRFVADLVVLGESQLGHTKSTTVYGPIDQGRRQQADAAGLDLGPISLQDLFVHLTRTVGGVP
jgi:ABC-2 type transport system ATP-binding protein